jgi:hypothetical protein
MGSPDGNAFLNGKMIMDIDEGLNHFFEVPETYFLHMFNKMDGISRIQKEKHKQLFLVMIAFLDNLYISEQYDKVL